MALNFSWRGREKNYITTSQVSVFIDTYVECDYLRRRSLSLKKSQKLELIENIPEQSPIRQKSTIEFTIETCSSYAQNTEPLITDTLRSRDRDLSGSAGLRVS